MMRTIIGVLILALTGLASTPKMIPAGSKIYVDSNNGFDLFILAAFQAKHLNAQLVSSSEKADYILDSSLFHSNEVAATEKAAGTYRVSEAAFKLTSKSGEIIWAYAATKGMREASEGCYRQVAAQPASVSSGPVRIKLCEKTHRRPFRPSEQPLLSVGPNSAFAIRQSHAVPQLITSKECRANTS
jgi:hypothetical protein